VSLCKDPTTEAETCKVILRSCGEHRHPEIEVDVQVPISNGIHQNYNYNFRLGGHSWRKRMNQPFLIFMCNRNIHNQITFKDFSEITSFFENVLSKNSNSVISSQFCRTDKQLANWIVHHWHQRKSFWMLTAFCFKTLWRPAIRKIQSKYLISLKNLMHLRKHPLFNLTVLLSLIIDYLVFLEKYPLLDDPNVNLTPNHTIILTNID
jgi:hypothetical protein